MEEPIPNPYIQCDQIRPGVSGWPPGDWFETEFHSLRPYQASACYDKKEDVALFCSNSLFLPFPVTGNLSQQYDCVQTGSFSMRCHFVENVQENNIEITISGAELPIMGNTQDVINSQNAEGEIDSIPDNDKVNHFVSWYLNGVINRPEYDHLVGYDPEVPESLINLKKIIDLSGPINKLLAYDVQNLIRKETINRTPQVDFPSEASESLLDENTDGGLYARHNQIIGCTWGINLPGITQLISIPGKCYRGGDSFFEKALNSIINAASRDYRRLGDYDTTQRIPPKITDYDSIREYWEAYLEWRGMGCVPVPLPGFGIINVCINNPLSPDWVARLWPYVPYSTTEDRLGMIKISSSSVQPDSADMTISNVTLNALPADLFFPHMQEVDELADILQNTYVAQGVQGNKNTPAEDSKVSSLYCDIANVRQGEGDSLFPTSDGDWPGGVLIEELSFIAEFYCDFILEENIFGELVPTTNTCQKTATVALATDTETPLANETYARLVDGDQSVFKRFYPQIEEGSVIDAILDLPAASNVNYTRSDGGSISVRGPNGGSGGDIYFPHIGAIHEYFLSGIQTALRPKGMGTGPISGVIGVDPGSVGNGSCSPGSGPCSVENLLPYLGNDVVKATKASIICNRESGSNPNAINDGCLTGQTVDYSIGLFQINLLAHCPGAFSSYTWDPPSCTIGNMSVLNNCIERYLNPEENIEKMVSLSRNGTYWTPWSAAAVCGIQ